jgi:hypothetical protein
MAKKKRPKKKFVTLTVFLTEATRKIVEKQVKSRGLSVTAYLRTLIRECTKGE